MTELDRYQLLVNAVAARPVPLLLSTADQQPFTDGQSITIPDTLLHDHEHCWLTLVAQATLLASGALQARIVRSLVGKRGAQQRYLSLEAMRARTVLADRLPLRFTEHTEWLGVSLQSHSPQQSLQIALQHQPLPPAPSFFGELRPLTVLRRAMGSEGLNAVLSSRTKSDVDLQPAQPEEEDEGAEESRLLKLFSNPLGIGVGLGKLLSQLLGGRTKPTREDDDAEGSGAELPIDRLERTGQASQQASATQRLEALAAEELPSATEYVYPEWNNATQSYRPQWVSAATVPGERFGGPRVLGTLFSSTLSSDLRRQLASLGLSYELHGHEADGTDLDLTPLIERAIDQATGYAVDTPRVYRAARRTRRDLGVCIVLDVSGSTGEGHSAQHTQFDQQLQVAWHLGAAFDALGDTVEMFGFHSWGRSIVRWLPLKSHEERWSHTIRERFAQLEPAGFTRLGAAIRHAHHRLTAAMRLPYRLMLLVTDGLPYDDGYEGEYARADVRKALAEAHSAGIACLCICVGADADPTKLHAVFGAQQLITIDEPKQLSSRIVGQCRRALAAVARRSVRSLHVA